MTNGLLFDKDGTLFSFQASWSTWAQNTLETLAAGSDQRRVKLAQSIGFDLDQGQYLPDSGAIAGTLGWMVDQLAPDVLMSRADLEQFLINSTAQAPMAPAVDLAPLMADFRARGLKLGVATNDAEAPARAHLEAAGVLEAFDFVAGYDSGFGAKPAPGMILGFAEAMGLAPEDIVMVGDSTHDLEAGRAAGCQTLGVLTGPAPAEVLAPLCDAVLPDIGEIPAWLDARMA